MPYHCAPDRPCPRCLLGLCHGCDACDDRGGHIVGPRLFKSEVVAISGARRHANIHQVHTFIDALPPTTTILTGLADGVDSWADYRAKGRGLRTIGIAAEWRKWGKGAGHVRNEELIVAADRLAAFPWWGCTGTYDAIDRAKSHRLPFEVIEPRCEHLSINTTRMGVVRASHPLYPTLLDITARTAREVWSMRRGKWRSWSPERAFHELADEASKLIRTGGSIFESAAALMRHGAPSLGAVFAPKPELLEPALKARQEAETFGMDGRLALAVETENAAWEAYVGDSTRGFTQQMIASRKRYPAVWRLIAAQPIVTLMCFCSRPKWWPKDEPWNNHCHRFLVAQELGWMGGKVGVEIGQEMSPQLELGATYNPSSRYPF